MAGKEIDNLKDIQQIQLNLLRELKRVCDSNNIRYYLCCGTCLGAVRHKGFVPWDDDIDVFMYINDVEKLKQVRDQFSDGCFLLCQETAPEFPNADLRLKDSRTTNISVFEKDLDINHGIGIDIYPLYYYPENKIVAHYNILLSYLYRLVLANRPPIRHKGRIISVLSRLLLSFYRGSRREKALRRMKRQLSKYDQTEYVCTYYGLDIWLSHALLYKSAWFEEPSQMEFEGEYFSGPTDPESYLKAKYGDYMKLPPEEKRKPSHDYTFIDTTRSYLEYKGVRYLVDEKGNAE